MAAREHPLQDFSPLQYLRFVSGPKRGPPWWRVLVHLEKVLWLPEGVLRVRSSGWTALCKSSKTFLTFCAPVLPLLRERCRNLHFQWWICLFPLCLVPFFIGCHVRSRCRRSEGYLPFWWIDPVYHFKYSFFFPLTCPGLESVVSDANQANFQPAFDQCLHSVMASVVFPEKTRSGPRPQDLWMWPYRK